MGFQRWITTRNQAHAVHGGRGATAAVRRRSKAGWDQTKCSERISSSPRNDEAKNETGGATVTRVDGDRAHGGEDFVGDVVSATVVGKITKQERNKDHSIKTKL